MNSWVGIENPEVAGRAHASGACIQCSCTGPSAQKNSVLDDEFSVIAILEVLIALFLNLCFVSKVRWDNKASTRD